jgi:hypothetical protein
VVTIHDLPLFRRTLRPSKLSLDKITGLDVISPRLHPHYGLLTYVNFRTLCAGANRPMEGGLERSVMSILALAGGYDPPLLSRQLSVLPLHYASVKLYQGPRLARDFTIVRLYASMHR